MKVLYIAGWGRSGSTILDNILGQVKGVFSLGELRYVWDRGCLENRLCSCNAPFRNCEVWKEIVSRAFGGFDSADAYRMLVLRDRCDHARNLVLGRRMDSGPFRTYRSALHRLYDAISVVSGAELIVDSSKAPTHGRLLQDLPGLDVHVLHLIRDPRAVAYSWQRKIATGDRAGKYMARFGPVRASLMWVVMQLAAEKLAGPKPHQYRRLLYEDLVAKPRETLEGILAAANMRGSQLPLVDERTVTLSPVHGFSGNPSRFKRGAITLQADNEWLENMRPAQRMVVGLITSPLLTRYGYRLTASPSFARAANPASQHIGDRLKVASSARVIEPSANK